MNSTWGRNAALLLIVILLWYVLSGIYSNQFEGSTSYRHTAKSMLVKEIEDLPVTQLSNHEALLIIRSGRMPSTKPGKQGRRLTMEELDELATTGKLPKR